MVAQKLRIGESRDRTAGMDGILGPVMRQALTCEYLIQ